MIVDETLLKINSINHLLFFKLPQRMLESKHKQTQANTMDEDISISNIYLHEALRPNFANLTKMFTKMKKKYI